MYCRNRLGWVAIQNCIATGIVLKGLLESYVAIQCIVLQQAARLVRIPVSQYKQIVLSQARGGRVGLCCNTTQPAQDTASKRCVARPATRPLGRYDTAVGALRHGVRRAAGWASGRVGRVGARASRC